MTSTATRAKMRVAGLSRLRSADDPVLIEARRALTAANIEAAIERITADGSTITIEQASRLYGLIYEAVAR